MEVLYLTIFVSVALVVVFVGAFLYHSLRASGDPLHDSLLPFRQDRLKAPSGPPDATRKTGSLS